MPFFYIYIYIWKVYYFPYIISILKICYVLKYFCCMNIKPQNYKIVNVLYTPNITLKCMNCVYTNLSYLFILLFVRFKLQTFTL